MARCSTAARWFSPWASKGTESSESDWQYCTKAAAAARGAESGAVNTAAPASLIPLLARARHASHRSRITAWCTGRDQPWPTSSASGGPSTLASRAGTGGGGASRPPSIMAHVLLIDEALPILPPSARGVAGGPHADSSRRTEDGIHAEGQGPEPSSSPSIPPPSVPLERQLATPRQGRAAPLALREPSRLPPLPPPRPPHGRGALRAMVGVPTLPSESEELLQGDTGEPGAGGPNTAAASSAKLEGGGHSCRARSARSPSTASSTASQSDGITRSL
mmetsp:Transcript_13290/g.40216  ORF Transcript_13290/g.40216 Transcript_13290/m.40216 type:complete len:277 (-) Transcript_13290:1155-1985(-)